METKASLIYEVHPIKCEIREQAEATIKGAMRDFLLESFPTLNEVKENVFDDQLAEFIRAFYVKIELTR